MAVEPVRHGLDRRAVVRAAVTGTCWVVPAGLLNALVARAEVGVLTFASFVLVLLGFVFCGFAAVSFAPHDPYRHAAAAGALCCLVPMAVVALATVARGDSPRLLTVALGTVVASSCAMTGAVIRLRAPDRSEV